MDDEAVVNQLVSSTKNSLVSRPSSGVSSFRIDQQKREVSFKPNLPSIQKSDAISIESVSVQNILDEVELSEVSLRSSRLSDNLSSANLPGKNSAYIIFFILGIGSLLPWNAFITSSTYYQTRFCGTAYENSFESFFSMLYTAAGPIGLCISILFQDHLPIRTLVLYPLIIYFGVFIIITIMVLITSLDADVLFGITLIGIGGCGICAALMSGGLFGLAGLLPVFYTGAIMNGQGVAGLSVSAVSLLIAAATTTERFCNDDDTNTTNDDGDDCSYDSISYGALAFYTSSSVVLMICIILFILLLKLEYVAYFIRLYYKERVEIIKQKLEKQQPNYIQDNNNNNAVASSSSAVKSNNTIETEQMTVDNPLQQTPSYNPELSSRTQTNQSDGSVGSKKSTGEGITGGSGPGYSVVEKYSNKSSVGSRSIYSPDIITALIDDIGKAELQPVALEEGKKNPNGNSRASLTSNSPLPSTNTLTGSTPIASTSTTATTPKNAPNSPNVPKIKYNPDISLSIRQSLHELSRLSFAAPNTKTIVQTSYTEIKDILEQIYIPAYSVFITFCGTLLVYPTIVVLIESETSCNTKYNSIFASILFTVYNLCDFIGRSSALYVSKHYQRYINAKNIWIYSNIRLILPFLLCFTNVSNTRLPILFPYDSIVILLLIFLGLSNGLFANLSMMYGPTLVETEYSALAGTIMVFCLSLGLLIGSCLSFLVLFIVIGSA